MYTVKVHSRIDQIISMFYFIGLWNNKSRTAVLNWFLRIWHLTVYGCYPFLLVIGALTCVNETETIFLGVMAIISILGAVRLYYFILKKDEVLSLIRTIGVHEINDSEKNFHQVNKIINIFIRFTTWYQLMLVVGGVLVPIIALPIFTTERRLPLSIYVPLDWKNNDFIYWMVYIFVTYEILMSVLWASFTVIIWYLMMALVFQFELLGNEFNNLGWVHTTETGPNGETYFFFNELVLLIKKHKNLQEETLRFNRFFSILFLVQIATSGLGICGSVFALAFDSGGNPVQYIVYVIALVYCVFDIFMVTYFGNEIILNSGNLSYSLFGSNWMDQSESSKKCILILMEVLKRPEKLLVGIYPLDLDIFTKILNLAYRVFNVLRA